MTKITKLNREFSLFNYHIEMDFINGFNIDFKTDLFYNLENGKLTPEMIECIKEWFIWRNEGS